MNDLQDIMMFRFLIMLTFAVSAMACASTQATTTDSPAAEAPKAVEAAPEAAPAPGPTGSTAAADIPWAPFNPKQPEGIHVYAIKGDPSKGVFSAIVKMPAGLKIPMHTHDHAYSGVVLSDGFAAGPTSADAQVLPKFTSWVQPAGASHVNECRSENPCIFMVNFKGAVNMTPVEETVAGDGAKTVFMGDAIPWKAAREDMPEGPKMHAIHGNPKEGAFDALIWFPAGMSTNIHTHSSAFAAVVLQGEHHRGASADAVKALGPGSVWHEAADAPHMEKCAGPEACIFAISFDGALDTSQVKMTTE
jgi:quercetin dioxygenase-like cupin family protein